MDESRSMLIIGLFQDAGKKIDQRNLRKRKKKTQKNFHKKNQGSELL